MHGISWKNFLIVRNGMTRYFRTYFTAIPHLYAYFILNCTTEPPVTSTIAERLTDTGVTLNEEFLLHHFVKKEFSFVILLLKKWIEAGLNRRKQLHLYYPAMACFKGRSTALEDMLLWQLKHSYGIIHSGLKNFAAQ